MGNHKMKKTLPLILIFLIMSACSLFRAKVLPYPEGIIFPLNVAHEVVFEGEIVDSLSQQEGRVYFSTRKGYVYCFDAGTQKEVWKFQTEDAIEMHPYSGRENLYVYDSANTLYCFNKEGRLIWQKSIKENISSGICEGPEQVFIGTEKGRVLSLAQSDGDELWNFQAGGALRTDPVFTLGKVVFGSDDHFLYILNLRGSLIAKFETQDKIRGGLYVDQGRLYFGSDAYHFYCYDLTKHKLKWKVKTGGMVRAYPIMDKKRVFFLCMNNVLYCLKKKNGIVLWWANIPSRSFFRPEIIDDRITVSALSPRLVCFDTETGKFAGEYVAPEEIRSNPLWTEPYLVLAQHDFDSDQGKLLFLDKSVYVTLTSSLGSPQLPNEEIIITASPGGFYLPQYEFYFRRYVEIRFGWMSYILLQVEENLQASGEKSEENTWSWFPEKPGVYFIGVKVTDEREKATAEFPFLVGNSGEK